MGSIIKTIDGGQSFTKMESNVSFNLNSVEFFNSTLGYCAGENGTLLKADPNGFSWTPVELGISSDLNDICIIQPQHAWVVGEKGIILSTVNEGSTWEVQIADSVYWLNTVQFIDSINGWTAGWDELGEGVVLRTLNGGLNWNKINGITDPPFSELFFTNAEIGWAVSMEGEVYKSMDGGISWEFQFPDPPATSYFKDIIFADEDHGWAVGVAMWTPMLNSVIWATENGGDTWEPQEDYSWRGFNGIYFTDPNHGCAVGAHGSITCTPDGGNSWTVLSGEYHMPTLFDLSITDEQTGWAAGGQDYPISSIIMHTIDGGASWEKNENLENVFYGIFFLDAVSGWVAGGPTMVNNKAAVLRTQNGGTSWDAQLEVETWLSFLDVCFISPEKGWAVGGSVNVIPPQGNLFFHTSNGGENWEDLSWITDKSLSSICFTDENNGWICGHETILGTMNGGLTWEDIWEGEHSLKEIFFLDEAMGWAIGDSIPGSDKINVIMATTDAGESWSKHFLNYRIHDISFTNEYEGWIVGDSGLVLSTNDGGNSWQEEFSRTSEPLYAVQFTSPTKGWMVGGHTSILHIDNGGMVNDHMTPYQQKKLHLQSFPNPFSSEINLHFQLENSEYVSLTILDHSGQILKSIVSKYFNKGPQIHRWNGENINPGVYFIRLSTKSGMGAIKIIKI